jgi:hypothetical protein
MSGCCCRPWLCSCIWFCAKALCDAGNGADNNNDADNAIAVNRRNDECLAKQRIILFA